MLIRRDKKLIASKGKNKNRQSVRLFLPHDAAESEIPNSFGCSLWKFAVWVSAKSGPGNKLHWISRGLALHNGISEFSLSIFSHFNPVRILWLQWGGYCESQKLLLTIPNYLKAWNHFELGKNELRVCFFRVFRSKRLCFACLWVQSPRISGECGFTVGAHQNRFAEIFHHVPLLLSQLLPLLRDIRKFVQIPFAKPNYLIDRHKSYICVVRTRHTSHKYMYAILNAYLIHISYFVVVLLYSFSFPLSAPQSTDFRAAEHAHRQRSGVVGKIAATANRFSSSSFFLSQFNSSLRSLISLTVTERQFVSAFYWYN